MLKLFFLADEYHGYIIKLTNVKQSPSKVKYFNAILNNGQEDMSLISYNTQLYQTMEAAKLKDKAVKIKNYYERHDEFQGKSALTLNDTSHVEYSTINIPFSAVEDQIGRINKLSLVNEIESMEVNDSVNLHAYVSLKNSITQDIPTKYGMKKKKDIELYDDTGMIKLSLWGNHINFVTTDGNYKFKDLRIRCYNGKYLTTTALTVIAESDEVSFDKSKLDVDDIPSQIAVLPFPAATVESFSENYFCRKCQHKCVVQGKLVVCQNVDRSHC